MKKITFIMIIITLTFSVGMGVFANPLLANTENDQKEDREKYLNIMTVNKPQYKMVKKIVQNKHNVQYMMTEETDINGFKYNKEIIENVSNMDLFIYSGTSFEPWANSFINELKKGSMGIINLSRGMRLLNYDGNEASKENPYYFEGIDSYKIALYNVKAAVQDRDPKNRDYYEENYNNAIKELNNQIEPYNEKIKGLKDYTFLALNDNFDYLTKDLGLHVVKLNNYEISEFIKVNNLDENKLIILKDGTEETNMDLSKYKVVNLWKYYGNMSFDELILYNIKVLTDLL
ncbi:metal ABC transporter substrate-binding protein [Clostridium cagae]|uniref:ABC transporter substrate-binding lipoprotein n=1 Tax=Clostridium botulinum (strain Eklund 17B / Type B) TaxID=935198 RepID=B2TK28_CLOBB|nr:MULTISPECIES: zinc ABC transporter substrate-binding protein [Clostridium]ACD21949.1 putative ABC transporter substrate-binding lipoprotein [Clostridium botulinum B str. Eklund 17B (NRP)]MBN1050898.1 ABC transporter substrate-binding protein [Clostridium botulinum]MBN1054194.1 ABC transporter substrate-binding protein [Clostridium botulinum]MBY6976413.1 metal ABC transporter substrate-binding protein [Clostridium botulinum]MBY7001655.1 metal ABC transporter substrate-binding protein [Clostr